MALTKIDDRGLKTPIDLLDNEKIRLGTGNDLEIYHNSSHSYIDHTGTGDLWLRSTPSGGDIYAVTANNGCFVIQNASGAVQFISCSTGSTDLYYDGSKKLETSAAGIACTGKYTSNQSSGSAGLSFADGVRLDLGAGDDLKIYHDGSTNIIDAATSNAISFRRGGSEQFFIGDSEFKGGDDKKIKLGTGDDLQLYHDSSNDYSYIDQTHATGHLVIRNTGTDSNIYLQARSGEHSIVCNDDGSVDLYHNNSKSFYTTDNGAVMQGYEGVAGIFELHADEGDDNADKWRFVAESGSSQLSIGNYSTGSWVNGLTLDGSNNATFAGTVLVNNRLQLTGPSIYDKSGTGNSIGIMLSSAGVLPTDGSGTESNNTKDLGSSSYKWKDIYAGGTVSDSKGNLRDIPFNNNAGAYTLVASDAGKVVGNQTGGWTIPANVFTTTGMTVTILNESNSDQVLDASALIYLYNTADGANVKASTLTLGSRCMATIWFSAHNVAYIQASALTVS